MPKFSRKKPIVIEAFQWSGKDPDKEFEYWPEWAWVNNNISFSFIEGKAELLINTLEGIMIAQPNDYIIKGIKGEIYPCKPDIFLESYLPTDCIIKSTQVYQPLPDIYKFQTEVIGNEFPDKPILLDGTMKEETLTCLVEESVELRDATNLPDQADALVDLIYFAYGALHRMGVDTQRVWDEVHRANMSKVRGTTKRNQDNDAAKPEDWKGPDHSWLIAKETGLTSAQD